MVNSARAFYWLGVAINGIRASLQDFCRRVPVRSSLLNRHRPRVAVRRRLLAGLIFLPLLLLRDNARVALLLVGLAIVVVVIAWLVSPYSEGASALVEDRLAETDAGRRFGRRFLQVSIAAAAALLLAALVVLAIGS